MFLHDVESGDAHFVEGKQFIDYIIDYANSEKLIKYFGEYLSYKDVCEILKIGDNGFSDNEIIDAFKIIPCTPNLQISVKDFINILY